MGLEVRVSPDSEFNRVRIVFMKGKGEGKGQLRLGFMVRGEELGLRLGFMGRG